MSEIINLRINSETKKKLKEKVSKEHTTISAIIKKFIYEYLES